MKLVSWSLKRLWEFLRDMGVFSESPRHLLCAFSFLAHVDGRLYYRMRPPRQWHAPLRLRSAYPPRYGGHICTFNFSQLLRHSEIGPRELVVALCMKKRPNSLTGDDGRILETEQVVPISDLPSFARAINQRASVILKRDFVSNQGK